ncbi:LON peptidase substrate-binding domain-containing protein [Rhodoferax sp. 4810]|uniref:LON peptidase substrate-binding domain-containing protein n=1 Tax=Thiospirillum jenense TaxID=1653858 RepID=A0A839H9X1_9GAMM|nr:LON peptidase substrate-binding domain-containing protein [Thiospirillum jenense]MBB1073525.1 LON peptidase substrate-binding domain-containing protein [Rhodoferax jenense]MBB1126013.1 LON peptidase substrate-binding domain-containing protein [Thiospirillum jenense]
MKTLHPFLPDFNELPTLLPIFPFNGSILLPGVQLPLNIFEPRYLNLVQAALSEPQHLLGLVQPVMNKVNDESPSLLHRIGCAGRITAYSETQDGHIILVLTGVCRFERATELNEHQGFRRIQINWARFADDYSYHNDTIPIKEREQLITELQRFCACQQIELPWEELAHMTDAILVNLLCAHLPIDPDDKQSLLEIVKLSERAKLLRSLLAMAVFVHTHGSTSLH